MENREEAKQNVAEWLKHPNELGCEPKKIEFTKEFTDEDGIPCMIFKYKKSTLSPWMLAIASDAGIFSEMQPYRKETEVEDAKKLIAFLKQYWKNRAGEEEERKERQEKAGRFLGFVLLKEPQWDAAVFEDAFGKDWKIDISAEKGKAERERKADEGTDAQVYQVERMRIILGYLNMPIPKGEAEFNAQYNYMWKDAVEVTKTHKAQIMVSIMGEGAPDEKGMLYAKVITTLCRQENTIGVYANGTVYEPKFIEAVSEMIEKGDLPLLDLVWFGLTGGEDGVCAYTCGLKCFGKDELEIVNSKRQPSELRDFLLNIAGYVLAEDVILHDGETVGYSNEQRLKIVKSAGVNVEGESLKIMF